MFISSMHLEQQGVYKVPPSFFLGGGGGGGRDLLQAVRLKEDPANEQGWESKSTCSSLLGQVQAFEPCIPRIPGPYTGGGGRAAGLHHELAGPGGAQRGNVRSGAASRYITIE